MDRAFAPLGSQISSVNYPRTYLETVLPIPCHSHNDYWRKRPLWSALATGCISVEADVWLVDGEIYVGHSRLELREDRTLAEMYINPLIDILGQRNQSVGMATVLERDPRPFSLGIFPQDPQQSLVLLVDFKTEGRALWAAVEKALQPLREREWLTVWDGQSRVEGPVTVVASGNAPFDVIVSNTEYRDIFYDAPLEALEASEDKTKNTFKYNQSNSYYASAGMLQSFGPVIMNTLRNSQIELVRGQIKQARLRGLVPRYWGTPRWPRRLRDSIWKILFKEGTGVLNVDDLRAVRKDTWG
ncbi:hypothetical protein GQ53DRAFT_857600 [Thozetella sp. PMI_491]|nr:hypothetical protein GQ53DRAFT_857600 [Thozetella sp. PMI_491]